MARLALRQRRVLFKISAISVYVLLKRNRRQETPQGPLPGFLRIAVAAAVVYCLGFPDSGVAQGTKDTTGVPSVFEALEGVWKGKGVLFQRPAEFFMEWHLAPGGFVRLSFQNMLLDENGNRTPVLRSEAIYLIRDSTIQGVWIDSRPQRIRLDAVATDTSLVTTWTADLERGRTEYVVHSTDEVVVRDLVQRNSEFHLFGEALYRRRDRPR